MDNGKNTLKIAGGGKETLSKYLRKQGMTVGEHTKTASQLKTAEPYLVTIGSYVTISHGVDFITHDNSVSKIYGVDRDLYGKIVIGDNCFIGAHAIIMYGVTIADNVIIAAGSVVTKSVNESKVIVAGNPAKIIGNWETYSEKSKEHVIYAGYLTFNKKKEKLIEECGKFVRREGIK